MVHLRPAVPVKRVSNSTRVARVPAVRSQFVENAFQQVRDLGPIAKNRQISAFLSCLRLDGISISSIHPSLPAFAVLLLEDLNNPRPISISNRTSAKPVRSVYVAYNYTATSFYTITTH